VGIYCIPTHNGNFAQRRSLDTWPDFESAKKAVETISVISGGETRVVSTRVSEHKPASSAMNARH
jgi:hypothetical protein